MKQVASVQGTVIVDGELAAQGVVAFHPDDGGAVAYGTIHKDGTYALRIGQGQRNDLDSSKIYPGKYTATVAVTTPSSDTQESTGNLREPSPRLTDAKFSDKTTSELKYEVVSGRNVINISVERARTEEDKVPDDERVSEGDDGSEAEPDLGKKMSAEKVKEEALQ